jgi:putative colanic acid biosynthesis UDP-glucose lipid carrier transferase
MKQGLEYLQSRSKRRFDLLGTTALCAGLLPATVLTAGMAAVDNKCLNPLFVQKRRGQSGKEFDIFKLRTLPAEDTAELKTFGTFDPRASRTGIFLRRSGLDEVPQLINIFKGDMSLVGPRPLTQASFDDMQEANPILFEEWREMRDQVVPGLTGPSQIFRHQFEAGVSAAILRKTMEIDIGYMEQADLAGDSSILASTPREMLRVNRNIVAIPADITKIKAERV